MDEEKLVKVEADNGETFDMLILKEFDYKSKKYAVLMEMDHDCDCGCDDDCDCGCQEGEECTCHECDCGCQEEECTCDDCHCEECDCEEREICILEIAKDEDGNEIFKSIDDESLFDEIIEEADKVLYEE